ASRFSRGMPVITGQNVWKHAFQLCTLVGSLWAIAPGAQAEIPSQPLGSQVTAASDCVYFTPVLAGDGQWIAAATNCSETNGLVMRHVVRIHRASRRVEAVTPPVVFSDSPSISADGQRVVFRSDGDLIPGQNPDRVLQLFLYDYRDRRYTQLTHFRSDTENRFILTPQLSGNGDSVVLTSDADFVPGQNEDGTEELFLFDLRSDRMIQITHTTPPARHQWSVISHDGQIVLFVENLQPQLPGGGTNLYAWIRQTGEIRLLIDSHIRVMSGVFESLVLADQGHRAAFASRMDFLGENTDLNSEDYTVEIPSGLQRQVTHSSTRSNLLPTRPARKDGPIAPPQFVEADDLSTLVVSAHDPAVMYMATRRWGMLKSSDAGRSWKLASHRLGSETVTCLVEDPAQRSVLYAGTANAVLYR